MSCTNCFNGCVEITSDKCTRYTGVDIPLLGITNGDSLAVVEQAIFTFLSTVANGSGINPNIGPICTLIANAFPPGEDVTLNVVLQAISDVICDLDTRITSVEGDITTLNADYDVDCLAGVTNSSDTHDVLQAVIDKLCTLEDSLTALAADLDVNYYTAAEVQEYVANQIAATSVTTYEYKKMIPYVAYPYFGSLAGNFDATGKGIGSWDKVYLCNGQNPPVPDLRGFSLVGATNMGSTALLPEVDTRSYATFGMYGQDNAQINLSESQMPTHTHAITATVTVPAHTHETDAGLYIYGGDYHAVATYSLAGAVYVLDRMDAVRQTEGLSTVPEQTLTATATINPAGSSQAIDILPPSVGCYFIMYMP